jgi:hypothetical protein
MNPSKTGTWQLLCIHPHKWWYTMNTFHYILSQVPAIVAWPAAGLHPTPTVTWAYCAHCLLQALELCPKTICTELHSQKTVWERIGFIYTIMKQLWVLYKHGVAVVRAQPSDRESSVQWFSHNRSEQLPTGIRRLEEEYCDVQENTYVQITRTVTCDVTAINPGNNEL